MSTIDKVPFTLNERYKSEDLNALQDILGAWSDDAAAFAAATRLTAAGSIPADVLDPVVLGGLQATPDGTNISIAAGVCILNDTGAQTDRPTSQRMLARQAAAVTVTMPAPVSDTWYAVVAAVAQTSDPTVSRDVWNTATQVWDPTLVVKRIRQGLTFSVVAGSTTNIPTSSARLVVCAVFRPAGGGPVLTSHILDLRPTMAALATDDGRGSFLRNLWSTNVFSTVATTLNVDTKVVGARGQVLWAQGAVDPLSAAFLDPTASAAAANDWYYIYLCPWPFAGSSRVAPRHAQGLNQQGLVVASKVTPTGRLNSNTLTMPAPFNNYTVAAGNAVCFAAMKRNNANSAFIGAVGTHDKVSLLGPYRFVTPAPTAGLMTLGGTAVYDAAPVNARFVSLQVQMQDVDNPADVYARYTIGGSGIAAGANFDLTLLEQEGGYSLASEEIVVPNDGVYRIDAYGFFTVSAGTNPSLVGFEAWVNGVKESTAANTRFTASTSEGVFIGLSLVKRMSAGQHIAIKSSITNEGADAPLSQVTVRLENPDVGIASYEIIGAGQSLATVEFPTGVTFSQAHVIDVAAQQSGGSLSWNAIAIVNTPQIAFKLVSYTV